jgi:hypothetical protein
MRCKGVWFTAQEWETVTKAVELLNRQESRDVRETWVPKPGMALSTARFIQMAAVTAGRVNY